MSKKCSWECPTCGTEFNKHMIPGLMNRLQKWLMDRPSPSIDSQPDKAIEYLNILKQLKSLFIGSIRKPTNMLDSQNAIGEAQEMNDATNQRQESQN